MAPAGPPDAPKRTTIEACAQLAILKRVPVCAALALTGGRMWTKCPSCTRKNPFALIEKFLSSENRFCRSARCRLNIWSEATVASVAIRECVIDFLVNNVVGGRRLQLARPDRSAVSGKL